MDYNSIGRQRGRPSRATGAPGRRTGLVAYHGLRLFGANPPLATNAFKDLSGASDAVTVPTAESPESPESPIDVASPPADSNIASGSADPSGSGLTASASPTSSPAPELAAHIQAIEGTLSFIDRASARLSANASGIRFGNVQKQEQRIRSAMRRIRQLAAEAGAAEAGLIAELDALRRDSSRLASSLTTVGASTASPAPETPLPALEGAPETAMTAVQATRIRQGITRSMVSLATAPLHLRIEFDPQFKDERPDTLLLAARIHALHRFALGTLREIRWVDVNRARLAFGDGREPTFVDAEFDAGGRLQLPETWRQAPSGGAGTRTPARTSPPSPPRAPPRPPTSDEARARRGNAEKAPRVGPPRQVPPSGPRVGTNAPPDGGLPRGRRDGEGRKTPASQRPNQAGERRRNESRAAPDPRAARPRGTINTTMADKLRAALAQSSETGSVDSTPVTDANRAKDPDASG